MEWKPGGTSNDVEDRRSEGGGGFSGMGFGGRHIGIGGAVLLLVLSLVFTHGSSRERTQWFQVGLNSGQLSACDTFAR